MTREEKFFATMRRWAAITLCMDSLGERDKAVLADLFLSRGLSDTAKKYKLTKERVRQIRERSCKILMDMIMDEPADHVVEEP